MSYCCSTWQMNVFYLIHLVLDTVQCRAQNNIFPWNIYTPKIFTLWYLYGKCCFINWNICHSMELFTFPQKYLCSTMRVFTLQFNQQIFVGHHLLCPPPALKASHCQIIWFLCFFSVFMISFFLQDLLCLFLNPLLPIHHFISGNTAPRNRVGFPYAWGRATAEGDLPLCALTTRLCICKAQTRKPVLFCRHSTLQIQVQFAIWYPPGLFLHYEFVGYSSNWIAVGSYFPLQTNFLPFSIF